MDSVLCGLAFCLAYLDDLLISSPSPELRKQHFSVPETRSQLRQFLGMVNFYYSFIPEATALLTPPTSLLKKKKRGQSIMVPWSDTARQAFHDAKSAFANVTLLEYPQESDHTLLQVDASNFFN